jgi:hypothetical protein
MGSLGVGAQTRFRLQIHEFLDSKSSLRTPQVVEDPREELPRDRDLRLGARCLAHLISFLVWAARPIVDLLSGNSTTAADGRREPASRPRPLRRAGDSRRLSAESGGLRATTLRQPAAIGCTPSRAVEEARDRCRAGAGRPQDRPLRLDLRAHDVASDDAVLRFGEVERKGRRDEPDLSYVEETSEACRRVAKSGDARMDACALEGAHDAVVIGWGELAREQKKRLVGKVGDADRPVACEWMACAEYGGDRLDAQRLALDAVHPLRMQNETDVDLAGDEPGGCLRAEVLARHHSHVRTVVRDRRQQRREYLEARRRCVAESHGSRQARAGKTRTLDRPLYCREHRPRLVEKRTAGNRDLHVTARAHKERRPEAALELLDLGAQRRLGDMQSRRSMAEVELLRNGEKITKQARLEFYSRRLSLARSEGLGRSASRRRSWTRTSFAPIVVDPCSFGPRRLNKAMSATENSLAQLMERNVSEVFGERDPSRRRAAIAELYADDCAIYDAEGESVGQAAISDRVDGILGESPPGFAFSLVSPAEVIHDLGRARWQMGPAGAPPVVRGMDVALFANGRIRTLYTFVEAPRIAEQS